MSWGPKRYWPLDRDPEAIPSEVKPGDTVLSDLIVRPHMADWLEMYPEIYPGAICRGMVWQVNDGQSFQLKAPRGRSIDKTATHCVMSWYRVWDGPGSPLRGCWSEDRSWEKPVGIIEQCERLIEEHRVKETEDA